MYCIKCGIEINDGLDFFDYCPKCGTVLYKEQNKNKNKNEIKSNEIEVLDHKQENLQKAESLNRFFNSSILLKIIGILLKIICLPFIPFFFILGYFLAFVSGIGNLVIGLLLMMASVGFIKGLFEFFADKTQTWILLTFLVMGIFFSLLALVITVIPAIFIGVAQLLIYFVFGTMRIRED